MLTAQHDAISQHLKILGKCYLNSRFLLEKALAIKSIDGPRKELVILWAL